MLNTDSVLVAEPDPPPKAACPDRLAASGTVGQVETGDDLNLKQVAARLGVHYMTAYRYVRQGRLPASRHGTAWRVSVVDLQSFCHGGNADRSPGPGVDGDRPDVDWAARLVDPLAAGDEPTAWALVERFLAAGHEPADCYLDVIVGALARVDLRVADGTLDVARQPIATAVAGRLVARLGARFRRSGRSRGTVVFGAPVGERHGLPIAVVADLVRLAGFDVLELGPDVPAAAFAAAAESAQRLVAVGLGITRVDNLDAARATIEAVRAVDGEVPMVVGGQAVLNPEVAEVLKADAWAPDGRRAVEVIEQLARSSSPRTRRSATATRS